MRKIIPLLLFIALICGAGAYSVMWYFQAIQLKAGAEQVIAAINSKQKMLTFEKLAVSGFPLELNLDVNQPHFTARMDQLLQAVEPQLQKDGLAPDEEQLLMVLRQLPEWTEDLTWAGH